MSTGDVYDWWSRHPRALDVLYSVAFLGQEERLRRRSLATLALTEGERVLELGCGPGNSFQPLRAGVGTAGQVVGVDASAGMARAANERATAWANVHAVHGDALTLPVPEGSVDAVYAAMSVSAMPDPAEAIRAAHRALKPDGRFVLLDAQPFSKWPYRLLNVVAVPVSRWLTDWVPEVDLSAAVTATFEHADVTTYNAGTILVARGEKAQADATSET